MGKGVPSCIDNVVVREYSSIVTYERDKKGGWSVREKRPYKGCLSVRHELLREHLERIKDREKGKRNG